MNHQTLDINGNHNQGEEIKKYKISEKTQRKNKNLLFPYYEDYRKTVKKRRSYV